MRGRVRLTNGCAVPFFFLSWFDFEALGMRTILHSEGKRFLLLFSFLLFFSALDG